ncbi:MAG: ABC transporter permease subunit [Planctomycetes bacterium]|nr:ABC transporter permease subunit [Planctomycetota bacterium]
MISSRSFRALAGFGLTLVLLVAAAPSASADQLADLRKAGVLRWGSDAEGGAPYVMIDPRNKDALIGYEVELADALAAALGVKAEMVQNDFKSLLPGLDTGNYDIAMNGLEITPENEQAAEFTHPYYLSFLQLSVRREEHGVHSLADLKGKKVGTLEASLAERLLRGMSTIETLAYSGQHTPYEDLEIGRSEAVLMDSPIAVYYGKPNPKLKFVGDPVSEVRYGIAAKKGETALVAELNRILDRLAADGTLRRIYERWGMWNEQTAKYLGDTRPGGAPAPMYVQFLKDTDQERTLGDRLSDYLTSLPLLARSACVTLGISAASMMVAMLVGMMLALMRLYAPAPFPWLAVAYIELVRGTPLLIQLYLIYYGLPNIGIQLSPPVAAILGLGLNYAASEAENYRAGILSIPRGQLEAALALSMSSRQAIRHVVLPQAVRVALPPVTNDFLALFKDSSLVSVITMVELTKTYGQLAATYNDYINYGLITAAIYFLLGLPFVRLARTLEQRLGAAYRTA